MSISLRLSSLEKRLNPTGLSITAIEQQPCGLCGRQFAKYTCPRCNVPYCSLTCYRSEAHTQCTEPFYKQAIEDEILSQPSKSKEEKKAMLEMLKRFEEESAAGLGVEDSDSDDEGGEVEGEEEGENNLAKKLAGVDIDTADPDELWNALSDEQRRAFNRLLEDPESEEARVLFARAAQAAAEGEEGSSLEEEEEEEEEEEGEGEGEVDDSPSLSLSSRAEGRTGKGGPRVGKRPEMLHVQGRVGKLMIEELQARKEDAAGSEEQDQEEQERERKEGRRSVGTPDRAGRGR